MSFETRFAAGAQRYRALESAFTDVLRDCNSQDQTPCEYLCHLKKKMESIFLSMLSSDLTALPEKNDNDLLNKRTGLNFSGPDFSISATGPSSKTDREAAKEIANIPGS